MLDDQSPRVNLDAIRDRYDAEGVIEALYHHVSALARHEAEGMRLKEVRQLTTRM